MNIDINSEISAVQSAIIGNDVRDSIASALQKTQDEINSYAPAVLLHGTHTFALTTSKGNYSAIINLGFVPTENTQIIGSIRRTTGTPTPLYAGLTFVYYGNKMTAYVSPFVPSSTTSLPAGTYHIDWLVTEQGV